MTTRNVFIANLAISDILLCAFTMPFTLVDVISNYWALGFNQVMRRGGGHFIPNILQLQSSLVY